jgi:peptide/nickel transport system substrate-binding protein
MSPMVWGFMLVDLPAAEKTTIAKAGPRGLPAFAPEDANDIEWRDWAAEPGWPTGGNGRPNMPRKYLRALLGAAAFAAIAVPAMTAHALEDKTIRFATREISPGLGLPEFGAASPGVYSLYPIYDSMTQISESGDVVGMLAESWKNIDPTTWHVTLKKGIKFQNGEDLTADAVVNLFEWLLTPEAKALGLVTERTNSNQLKAVSVKQLDAYTVEFKTAAPNPEFPRFAASFWIPAPTAWRDRGRDSFSRNPVGTGPYKAVEYDGGVDGTLRLEAFEGAGVRPPKYSKLTIVALADAAARVSGIASDQLDIAQGVSFDAKEQLEAEGHKVDVAERPSAMGWRFMSVRKNSPFSDVRVRQAANMAIDRAAMANDLLGGITVPASQCATRGTFGFNPAIEPYPYDPARAKQLLAEAGYPNGFDTEAMVLPGAFPADSEIYQFAAQQLSAIGIRTKLTPITFPQWLDNWYGKTKGPEDTMGFSDIFQNSCHNDPAIATFAYPNLTCRKAPLASHCDEAEEAKLTEAEQEFDVEKRRKLIQELMVLNHDNAPNLFFVELVDMTGLNKRVSGFTNVLQRYNFHSLTLN